MRVRIEIDGKRTEPEAVILTPQITEEILLAQKLLEGEAVNGYREGSVIPLRQAAILRVFTEGQKVFAQTAEGLYQLRQRMYVMEALLDGRVFIRISNAEIVNSRAILRLDVSLAGTIGVELQGGIRTYASRRYVRKLREFFAL